MFEIPKSDFRFFLLNLLMKFDKIHCYLFACATVK